MSQKSDWARGSLWREWDLHIHSPASFHWMGEKLSADVAKNTALWDQMIKAINEAAPAAFAVMDYWTFDGWFALKKRLGEHGAPVMNKIVFPGIELRLVAPMEGRLNAHVIFSDQIPDQHLHDFKARLRCALTNQPLSDHALMHYAREAGEDKLSKHGYKKAEVQADDKLALRVGSEIAEITYESYKEAVASVPDGLAVGFMPFTTNDGLAQIKWSDHYAYALGLFQNSPIFETRSLDHWNAFVGVETSGNKDWFKAFQTALKEIPRLAVSGSDAHQFKSGTGANERGYGDFPSAKKTWIKADPTWKGLLQAIKEPAKRSFLGQLPPKLERIAQNKTFYIDSVEVSKVPGSSLSLAWLDGCTVPLNPDLVAIIGNKGSGKSALADIVALLGNSQQNAHFSFLKRDRFRGKSGDPAKQFKGKLNWLVGDPGEALLSDDPSADRVELVKYIPQGRFEALCNDHVSGKSDAFEKELRNVIFTHVPAETRLEALDFDQLIDQQEGSFRAQLSELRKALHSTNLEIVSIEDRLAPDVRRNIDEQLKLKNKQLEEHNNTNPVPVQPPAETLTDEQADAAKRLDEIEKQVAAQDLLKKEREGAAQTLAKKKRALEVIRDRVSILEGQVSEFNAAIDPHLSVAGLKREDIVTFSVDRTKLISSLGGIDVDLGKIRAENIAADAAKLILENERPTLAVALNEPQQRYQKYLADARQWEASLVIIVGSETEPESQKGLQARLLQLDGLPSLLAEKQNYRATLTEKIHITLSSQRDARAALFKPLQEVIQQNALIREEYKLQFQANLHGSPEAIASNLFDLIKRNVGELRGGEDEAYAAVRSRYDKYQFKAATDAKQFAADIVSMLDDATTKAVPKTPGIRGLLRKEKDPVQVYDLIFGLEYLEPKYTLLFQDTEIEQLSPGQRGALLLIFYLLVDKGRNPIVLDQPEENLDNETVVSLLVPVLNEAKRTRQIIMVTHNPNLAVVCDAEQIIHAVFERKNQSRISYNCGSIEDGVLNRAVVDVLEGTKFAFNNRGQKYH